MVSGLVPAYIQLLSLFAMVMCACKVYCTKTYIRNTVPKHILYIEYPSQNVDTIIMMLFHVGFMRTFLLMTTPTENIPLKICQEVCHINITFLIHLTLN